MKKARFSDEKMVLILQEADRTSVAAVAKKYGISDQTLYNWRKQFGGLAPSDIKRLRQLDQENARLKKIVAERDLELESRSMRLRILRVTWTCAASAP